jgi:hypothetical protein
MSEHLTIVLGAPGEAEMPLLADVGARDDVTVLAVVDPGRMALGSSIAEAMGLTVVSSLDELPSLEHVHPLVVMPADKGAVAVQLRAEAKRHGLETIATDQLRARLFGQRPEPRPRTETPGRPGVDEIERESLTIQESLAGLEDALAGDTILRRILDMCTRAVSAGGGSIMLFDEASRELYIAYAVGLSEATLHSTRIKLGEGIAGRVARTRQAELVEGQQGPTGRHRDRPDIATAVCVPLVAEERLLGVLNVSSRAGETPLDAASRDLLVGLGARLARILDGVQNLQRQRTSRMFHLTEQQLRRLAGANPELPDMFTSWTEALAVTAEAARVSLVVPCADGGLLACECAIGECGRYWYEPLRNPAWIEVLATGVPMVVREEDVDQKNGPPVTVFYLPVGRDPVRAGLAVHFSAPHTAHAFHALAGETVFLLERLLPDQVDRRRQEHRAGLLSDLSAAMGQLAGHDGTPGRFGENLGAAARRLTGAQHVAVIAEVTGEMVRLAGGNVPEGAEWLAEVPRLIEAAREDGWRITTLEASPEPLSVLVAVAGKDECGPALVLAGKERTHTLDGQVFTPLDAELVVPLAGLLHRLQPEGPPEPPPLLPEGFVTGGEDAGTFSQPLAVELGPAAMDMQPVVEKSGEDTLLDELRRELDRCDRYHNVCGLILLHPEVPEVAAYDLLEAAARRMTANLRISDRVFTLENGSLAILVPENIQNLNRLQARLIEDLRDLAGDPDLPVAAARSAYPSTKGPADAFLARVRERMEAARNTAARGR